MSYCKLQNICGILECDQLNFDNPDVQVLYTVSGWEGAKKMPEYLYIRTLLI